MNLKNFTRETFPKMIFNKPTYDYIQMSDTWNAESTSCLVKVGQRKHATKLEPDSVSELKPHRLLLRYPQSDA